MSSEHGLLLHQISTESALPGLVAVRRLVRFPALVVHKGHAAQVAGVAVLQSLSLRLKQINIIKITLNII